MYLTKTFSVTFLLCTFGTLANSLECFVCDRTDVLCGFVSHYNIQKCENENSKCFHAYSKTTGEFIKRGCTKYEDLVISSVHECPDVGDDDICHQCDTDLCNNVPVYRLSWSLYLTIVIIWRFLY